MVGSLSAIGVDIIIRIWKGHNMEPKLAQALTVIINLCKATRLNHSEHDVVYDALNNIRAELEIEPTIPDPPNVE